MSENHYPKLWHLLSPEQINIEKDITLKGPVYVVLSKDYPFNAPQSLPEYINRAFVSSEFVQQVKRYFDVKRQNEYMPNADSQKEEKNVEFRIKELIKKMEAL